MSSLSTSPLRLPRHMLHVSFLLPKATCRDCGGFFPGCALISLPPRLPGPPPFLTWCLDSHHLSSAIAESPNPRGYSKPFSSPPPPLGGGMSTRQAPVTASLGNACLFASLVYYIAGPNPTWGATWANVMTLLEIPVPWEPGGPPTGLS